MKKLFMVLAVAVCSMLMMAQTQQITWVNGRAVMGQSIESIDSLKYGTMVDADQLVLWLPKTIVVHDTVVVHDTIVINDCGNTGKVPAGVEMVDLGLTVKWANMNIGATAPEEYGDYFAWGETELKADYSWSTYMYCSNGSWKKITKYTCPDGQTSGIWYNIAGNFIGDGKTTLEPEDDAAQVNWEGNWRMPTKAELNELRNNCTWTWTTLNGVNGYQVTGTNGNSIFLPAAGYRGGTYLYGTDSRGYYWSSSLNEAGSNSACSINFNSGTCGWYYDERYSGYSVRAVCQ